MKKREGKNNVWKREKEKKREMKNKKNLKGSKKREMKNNDWKQR